MLNFPPHKSPPVIKPLPYGALKTPEVQCRHLNEILETHHFRLKSSATLLPFPYGLEQGR